MKSYLSQKTLVRKYVKELLREDGSGEGLFTGEFGGYGYGTWGSPKDLYTTFVKPFTDVFQTAVGGAKEVTRRARTILSVAFEGIVTSIVPFLSDSYDEIFQKEAADIAQIRSEYQQYWDATTEALGGDALALAFIAFPGVALTGQFAKTAPKAAANILSIATGGLSDKYLGRAGGKGKKGPSDIFDSYARSYYKLIIEDKEEKSEESTLADKLGGKKFVNALLNRSIDTQLAAKEAQRVYKKTLDEAYAQAVEVLRARDIATLEKITKQKFDEAKQLDQLSPEEKQKATQMLLDTIKKSIKKVYTERLKFQVAPLVEAFGDDHPVVIDYYRTINKIEAL